MRLCWSVAQESAQGQSRQFDRVRRFPLYPYKRTSSPCVGMSQMCQQETFADAGCHLRQPRIATVRGIRRARRHARNWLDFCPERTDLLQSQYGIDRIFSRTSNVQQQEASHNAEIFVKAIHAGDSIRTCHRPIAMPNKRSSQCVKNQE
jgi:hypothetical protein